MADTERLAPPKLARYLGYSGLIPFVGLGVASCVLPAPWRAQASLALLSYGAAILSFLGAIHWGFAMRKPEELLGKKLLLWGVTPSLIAWVALLLPAGAGLLLVAVSLWLCLWVDNVTYPKVGVGTWLPMRLALTAIASVACLAGAWSVLTAGQ